MADVEHAGAAKRRRERRLRQWLRHERMTVAMAVAEATHHLAPLRQRTSTSIWEVEEQATHDGLRARSSTGGRGQASSRSLGRRGVTRRSSFSRVGVAGWWRRHGRRYGRGGGTKEERGGAEGRREDEVGG